MLLEAAARHRTENEDCSLAHSPFCDCADDYELELPDSVGVDQPLAFAVVNFMSGSHSRQAFAVVLENCMQDSALGDIGDRADLYFDDFWEPLGQAMVGSAHATADDIDRVAFGLDFGTWNEKDDPAHVDETYLLWLAIVKNPQTSASTLGRIVRELLLPNASESEVGYDEILNLALEHPNATSDLKAAIQALLDD